MKSSLVKAFDDGADALQRLVVFLGRILLRAAEHQVLEEVSEAGVPGSTSLREPVCTTM